MRFGTHYLIGINTFDYDPYKTIDRAARLGYDALEIPFGDLMEEGGERKGLRIAEYAAGKGIKLVFCGGLPDDCDMVDDDPKRRENGVRYLHKMFPLMKKMDVDMLVGCHYSKWPSKPKGILAPEEKQKLVERTAEVYRVATEPAADCGVTCAIESLNRFEGFLLNCSRETAAFVDMVGNPAVKMHFDIFHMCMEEDSITGALETAGPRLAALHMAERNRRFPGTGDFCWPDFFATLKKIGFDGYMDLEVFMNAGGDMSAVIGVWRDLTHGASEGEMDEMHAEALRFLKGNAKQYGLI